MKIKYPYQPAGREIQYVSLDNSFMAMARHIALTESLDDAIKTAAVVVKEGTVIATAANGSGYHKSHVCERVRLNIPTGQGYDLCEGCHPKNHAEGKAMAQVRGAAGADVYLWGHWWCCESCWSAMIAARIKNIFLLEQSEKLFNKEHPDNILGRW